MRTSQRIAYLGCSFGLGVFSAFNNFTLTLWLQAGFTSSYLLLALLGNSRSFEGAIVSPLVGAWSDRTWAGWLGRRRPFILVGGLLSAALLALTPTFSAWALPSALVPLVGGLAAVVPAIVVIFLFTLTFNVMDDVHKALLADVTTPDERNGLSAWAVVVDMAGNVAILALGFLLWRDRVPTEAFVIAGALLAVGVLITVVGVREPSPLQWEAERQEASAPAGSLSPGAFLRLYRGAVVLCLVNLAYWSGLNAVMPLISVYTHDILGATVGQAQLLPGLLLLATTLVAFPAAWLGNRYGKRLVMSAGFVLISCAALAALVITTVEQGVAVFVVAGVGNAGSAVLMVPLLADLVPRHHMGVATGGLAASGSLAAPFATLVAGRLADLYGPRAIFVFMVMMVLVALVLLPAVQPAPLQPGKGAHDESAATKASAL
ncbi:MAG TPA: MFS transporter [Chloroflexota bacterium]|nr:MFS transporter [Chloroflexota bacterium]